MIVCASCRRHHRPDEPACPFCRARRVPARAGLAAGVAAAVLSLSACYGAPPIRPADEEAAPVTTTSGPGDGPR